MADQISAWFRAAEELDLQAAAASDWVERRHAKFVVSMDPDRATLLAQSNQRKASLRPGLDQAQADEIRPREFLASGALEQRTVTIRHVAEIRAPQLAFGEQRQQLDREDRDAISRLHLAHASLLEAAQQEAAIRLADATDHGPAAVAQLHTMISKQQARVATLAVEPEANTHALETLRRSQTGRLFSVLGGPSLLQKHCSVPATHGPSAASSANRCSRRLRGLAA